VIWFRSGRVPFLSSSVRAVISIVIVGLGVSLVRKAAPKRFGAALSSRPVDNRSAEGLPAKTAGTQTT
jgi:hypothetical protein